MAHVDWMIKGSEIGTCNCNWGCPCQFNSLPSNGDCRAALGVHIDEGHFGDVKLDGLNFAALYAWPGPVHEGNGESLLIVDEKATPEQKDALTKIFRGEETEPMTTFFSVFAAMTPTFHKPISKPIKYELDLEERKARLSVPDIVEVETGPIINPVTGNPHRAKVVLPHGFEYAEAEYASGTWKSTAVMMNDLTKRHAHLAGLHIGTNGVIR